MLRHTKGGGSSTESLINHLKSKHRIYVAHESGDHKTIPAQEDILSQIVKKEISPFEATKKRSNNLEKLFHALITIRNRSFRSGRFGLAVSVWAVLVWAVSVWAVSVTGHFGHDISVHKQLITFVYLNDYKQAKCHSSWCYTNSLWGAMIAIKSQL